MRFEEINQQQKKLEEEAAALKLRPKKTHPALKTATAHKMENKAEVLRQSKLALAAAISKGALNNVRSSSKEMASLKQS